MRADYVSEASDTGFWIQKVVSDTTISTGQTFSYTIYYSIPAGATNITIEDTIPNNLMFVSATYTNSCGTPTVSSPLPNQMGGVYSLSWTSVPYACSGSFTIVVEFPNGITCPGTEANNLVCLEGQLDGKPYQICTKNVTTVAIAHNPWHIYKAPLNLAYNSNNNCYVSGSDTIAYRLCVYKDVGTTGQLNLLSGIVTDTLPAGALLVNSNCGATQVGRVIQWNIGNLNALTQYNTSCCDLTVWYPSAIFPEGTQVHNFATLSGVIGSPNNPCDTFSIQSNQTCIELAHVPNVPNATFIKWVSTNGQPGCGGRFRFRICNTGTEPLHASLLDTLPSQLTNYTTTSSGASISGNLLQFTGTILPGNCKYIYVDFDIPSSAIVGSIITNCATTYFDSTTGIDPVTDCVSFTINAPAPKPCLWKEVCDAQTSYSPGSIFRYRLRIQNIGGQPITGATIIDHLDPNLQYMGNPSYYTSNTWNTPCTSTSNWSGVSISYNSSNNSVSIALPTIPATCQNIFYPNCGMYGTAGVPFYFIEFDVKVQDTSALGNIPNHFSINGGNLDSTTTPSNTVYILVAGVTGFHLEKGIKLPNDTSYVSNILVNPGSTVNFKLSMNSSGTAALRYVTFADLLPKDEGTLDRLILHPCFIRGSQFDISYSSFITSSSSISQWNNPISGSLANVNNLQPTGSPGFAFNIGCGSAGTWYPGWSTGMKNIAAHFGPSAISTNASLEFAATVSPDVYSKQTACNTFAASGFVKHLIQSSMTVFKRAGQSESSPVCVTIDTISQDNPCIDSLISVEIHCIGENAGGHTEYSIQVIAQSSVPAIIYISSPDGTFSPNYSNLTSNPWTINTTFEQLTTSDPIQIYYTISFENGRCLDSLSIDLPDCPPPDSGDDCCTNFYHNITSDIKWTSDGKVTLNAYIHANQIDKFSATIVSAQLRKPSQSWTRIYGDITGGSLITAPALGPQLLSIYSREAVWGPGECIDWRKGAALKLNMIFPPVSSSPWYIRPMDTLMFSIRYSFRDCNCLTCDTLITYKIVRQYKPLPWWDERVALIKPFAKTSEVKSADNNELQSDAPAMTSLIMSDINNGIFWVINPDDPDNDITITGIGFNSPDVALDEIKIGTNIGMILGDIGFIQEDILPGDQVPVMLKFNNDNSLKQFPVYTTFYYKIAGDNEEFTTDPILYTARVPDAEPDNIDIDLATKPTNVASYAIYINNTNGYNEKIYAIKLQPKGTLKIIAAGPISSNEGETYLIPTKLADNSYIVTVPTQDNIGIDDAQIAKPIFLTLSGVDVSNTTIDFTTYDMNMQPISNGSFNLSNPISAVQNQDPGNTKGDRAILHPITPNPAMNVVTVSYSLPELTQNIELNIIDMLGKEVKSIVKNLSFDRGTYIQNIDIANLSSGYYMIILKTNNNILSQSFYIVK